ncbi:MAG: sensor histidine kinase [Planctomycetota bacterium]
MRVSLRIADPYLRRALQDLLRANGHQVLARCEECAPCDLRIATGTSAVTAWHGTAVLLLRPPPGVKPDPDPRGALRRILKEGGSAVWGSPFSPRDLLAVIGEGTEARPQPEAPARGGLEEAPAPWLMVDPGTGRVEWANPAARDLWEISPPDDPTYLEALPPVEEIHEAVQWQTEGMQILEADVNGDARSQLAVWWTEGGGRRIVGLLEHLVGGHEASDRALQPLAELGRMAATVAHEVRNPVASVAGALELLVSESDADERAEIVGMARARLDQMRTLLDEILSLSRPVDAPVEPVDLREATRSAAAIVRSHPDAGVATIDYEGTDEPLEVRSHAEPLRRAIINLFLNAFQAQSGNGTVHVSWERDGRWGVLRIRDDGPGIPAEVRSRIFEPFYTTKSSGTGLGLAYVKNVVRVAGGKIEIEDVPKGASIKMMFPLARDAD